MKDYQLTKYNFDAVVHELKNQLDAKPVLLISVKDASIGKWTMTRLWRSWMDTTAKYMVSNGVTMPLMISKNGKNYGTRPFNKDDAHDLFTSQYLGVDSDGLRLTWSMSQRDGMRPATKGERFHAMQRHEQWSIDKGIKLMQPSDSEFMRMKHEQDK